MNNKYSEDEFLLLSEPAAVDHHFMAGNYAGYKWLVSILFFLHLISLPANYKVMVQIQGIPGWIGLAVWGGLWWFRKREFTKHHIYLLLKFVIFFAYISMLCEDPKLWAEISAFRLTLAFTFPCLLIFFRLKYADSVFLMVVFYAINVFDILVPYQPKSILRLWILLVVYTCILAITLGLTKRKKKVFLKRWRKEVKKNRDRLRMKQELEKAREIQLAMLPKTLPVADRYELSGRSLPATEVGGDYYDLFNLDEHGFTLVVGDVSGHGLGSGLVLSGVRAGLLLLLDEVLSPRQVLYRLNRMLKGTTDNKTFMTMVCAQFQLTESRMEMVVSNAGHLPIIHYHTENNRMDEVRQPALPLGMRQDITYHELRVSLKKGDVLIFYSDGLSEARDAMDIEYGEKRFQELLARELQQDVGAECLLEAILADFNAFSTGTLQQDDITLVIVKIK